MVPIPLEPVGLVGCAIARVCVLSCPWGGWTWDGAGQPVHQEHGAELLLWERLRAPVSPKILGRCSTGTAGRTCRTRCLKQAIVCRGWMQALGASHPVPPVWHGMVRMGRMPGRLDNNCIFTWPWSSEVPCSRKSTVKSALKTASSVLVSLSPV